MKVYPDEVYPAEVYPVYPLARLSVYPVYLVYPLVRVNVYPVYPFARVNFIRFTITYPACDSPKPLETLGFQLKVMGNDPPNPLKMLGFLPKIMCNNPPKLLKTLGFQKKVMGNAPPKPMLTLRRNRSLRKGSVNTAAKPSNALVSCRTGLERTRGPGAVVGCRRVGARMALALHDFSAIFP